MAATTYLSQLDKGSSTVANNQTSQAGVVDVRGEESFCTQKQQGIPEITPERRVYLLKRLQETKQNLANIDAALKKIAELNAQDLKALQQLGAEINLAYDDSVARLAEVAVDLLHDSLLCKDKKAFDKTTEYYEESLAEIDKSLSYRLGMKTTALEPKELQKVEERIKVLQSSKVRLQEWYERIKLLYQEQQLKKGKVIVYTKDVAVVGKQENFMEKAKEGFWATVGIALDYPGLEEAWKSVKIFSKARFDIVSGTWTYGQYIVDYTIDILAQRYAWEPLLKQLNSNIEANRAAVLSLQQKFKEQQKELECLEAVLR